MTKTESREGPRVTVERSCYGCRWLHAASYRVQGDSGTDYTCSHPSRQGNDISKRYVGDSRTATPDWCPVMPSDETPVHRHELAKPPGQAGICGCGSVHLDMPWGAPECPECKGTGRICTGDSGTEADGYAPTIERCEACDGDGLADQLGEAQ